MNELGVCIACLNRADMVRNTLAALTCQSFREFNVYMAFHGSTDNWPSLIKDYPQLKINVIHKPITGIGVTKHDAAEMAINDGMKYIQMLDSDDIPDSDMLKENYNRIKQGDVDWVLCWGKTFGENSGTICSYMPTLDEEIASNKLHSWITIRADVMKEFNYRKELLFAEDWDLWIRLFQNNKKGAIIEKLLLNYRVHNARLSRTYKDGSWTFDEVRNHILKINNIKEIKQDEKI